MSSFPDPGGFIADSLTRVPRLPPRAVVLVLSQVHLDGPEPTVDTEEVTAFALPAAGDIQGTAVLLARVADACVTRGTGLASLIVIDPDWALGLEIPAMYGEIVIRLSERLRTHGPVLADTLIVTGSDTGHAWIEINDGDHGVLA